VLTKALSAGAYVSGLVVCVFAMMTAVPAPAAATITTGEQLNVRLTDRGYGYAGPYPAVDLTGDLTVGAYTGSGQLYEVSQFSLFDSRGFCSTCQIRASNLSRVFIDSTDLTLSGDVTGIFSGSNQGAYELQFSTDIGLGALERPDTWSLAVADQKKTFGTYFVEPLTSVDEPAAGPLIALAMIGVWIRNRSRQAPDRQGY
jgi:hypothetical protein